MKPAQSQSLLAEDRSLSLQCSLASWPMMRHEDALAQALAGADDPVFGRMGVEHVQLVPQSRGLLDEDLIQVLRTMAPSTQFRLHANVRVLPEHRFADLTNAQQHKDYFLQMATVHRALGAKVYSAHSGLKSEGSWVQTLANVFWLQDMLGCPVAIEGQYPSAKSMHLESWEEYASLLRLNNLSYVIDLSHLNILAHKTRKKERELVAELLANERCLEVHISSNNGRGDWHAVCTEHVWWMDLLHYINPKAVCFSEGNLRRRDRSAPEDTTETQ